MRQLIGVNENQSGFKNLSLDNNKGKGMWLKLKGWE